MDSYRFLDPSGFQVSCVVQIIFFHHNLPSTAWYWSPHVQLCPAVSSCVQPARTSSSGVKISSSWAVKPKLRRSRAERPQETRPRPEGSGRRSHDVRNVQTCEMIRMIRMIRMIDLRQIGKHDSTLRSGKFGTCSCAMLSRVANFFSLQSEVPVCLSSGTIIAQ